MAANVLETFFILFQSDAEEVKEGAEEAEKTTDKLDKKLKETDVSAKKAGDSFQKLAKRAVKALTPILGLAAIKHVAVNFAANALAADDLSRTIGVNIESLQAWQGAAERVGGDASALASSMGSLNDKMLEMRRTGGGEAAAVFYHLGVSIRDSEGKFKTADKMLLSLADKFQGLSRERAMRLGEKLGLDEGTITLLQKGGKGVEELLARQKELGLYSKRDAEESRKFKNAMADLFKSFDAVAAVAMRVLIPVFTSISEGITKAAGSVRKHENLITGFFVALSIIMGVLAIKTGIAFAPFFAMAAVILAVSAAFAILYDDIVNFMDGNDSLIGKIAKDYPFVGDLVRGIVSAFKGLWEIAKAVGLLLVNSVESPTKAWMQFKATVMPILEQFFGFLSKIGDKLKGLLNFGPFKKLFKMEETADVTITNALPPDIAANVAASKTAIAQTGTPLASASGEALAGGRNVSNSTTLNVGTLEVNTQATDADGIATGISGALESELQAAAEQFDDGVLA